MIRSIFPESEGHGEGLQQMPYLLPHVPLISFGRLLSIGWRVGPTGVRGLGLLGCRLWHTCPWCTCRVTEMLVTGLTIADVILVYRDCNTHWRRLQSYQHMRNDGGILSAYNVFPLLYNR